ncbi:MAG TPA: GNAT family N-acetyltransferase [Tepidisphaeraceae bacterium]|jgi:ribosomal protein S18 acetylase RimI-like enzyme|nr:GNAT family N-acetyltransferase [Tepidisphaeraceae bacterium]
MTIRPATPTDVPAVLPMVEQIVALHAAWDPDKYAPLPDVPGLYRGWLMARARDTDRSVFLVAEREGQIVGFLVSTIEREIPIYRTSEYAFIHDLWVEPAYRNEGIGRQMAMLAIERFTELGVEQVRLETAAANDVARALFAKCGFRVSTIDMLLTLSR